MHKAINKVMSVDESNVTGSRYGQTLDDEDRHLYDPIDSGKEE